jgi:hypothetical protein
VRSRGVGARVDVEPIHTPRASKNPFDSTPSIAPGSTFRAIKPNEGSALEDLIKGFRELKVEFSELKKARGASSSQPSEEARKYPRRCVWCDEVTEHTLRGCESYEEALKNDLVTYKDGKIHDTTSNSPLRTNFGKGRMKKLMEEKMTRTNRVQVHGAETYHVQVEQHSVDASSTQSHVQMKRGAQAIRRATGWENPVDANNINVFLNEGKYYDDLHDASVEEKRVRFDIEDEEEPMSKRRPPLNNDSAKEIRRKIPTRSKSASPDTVHPEDGPLPDKEWGKSSCSQKPSVFPRRNPLYPTASKTIFLKVDRFNMFKCRYLRAPFLAMLKPYAS